MCAIDPSQYYYYRKHHTYYHPSPTQQDQPATETTPLVDPSASSISIKRPHQLSIGQELLRCAMGLGLVTCAGILTWYVTTKVGWKKHPIDPGSFGSTLTNFTDNLDKGDHIEWKWDAQISGWASAFLYREFGRHSFIKFTFIDLHALLLPLYSGFENSSNLQESANKMRRSISGTFCL